VYTTVDVSAVHPFFGKKEDCVEVASYNQDELCRALRSAGLTKEVTHELVNTIDKWVNSSGIEWTVARLKAYHHWYITSISGKPEPPDWSKRTSTNQPIGVFGNIFRIKNQQRALAALSAHTYFVAKQILPSQEEKFRGALSAPSNNQFLGLTLSEISPIRRTLPRVPEMNPPTLEAITGDSIPVGENLSETLHPSSTDERLEALALSWASVPAQTLRFLGKSGYSLHIPPGYGGVTLRKVRSDEIVLDGFLVVNQSQIRAAGRIACIQEPSLKARWIANPNRVTQHYLRPFGEMLYRALRKVPTDCTFNQDAGMRWVSDQLVAGVTLTGADLSSATDLLDMTESVRLAVFKASGRDISQIGSDWSNAEKQWINHINHFLTISRMEWKMPNGTYARWSRGQPLGTFPSFAVLGLTNNCLAEKACVESGIPKDSFRVIGDDVIMDTRAYPAYRRLVEQIGGVINETKTLTSKKIGEFAGRIITSDRAMLKRIKLGRLSDDSFMSAVAALGEQSKALLRPRQRAVYEDFKFVPGIAVSGPFSKESFGEPLSKRYFWYLSKSGLSLERPEPDLDKISWHQLMVRLRQVLAERRDETHAGHDGNIYFPTYANVPDDFQSSVFPARRKDNDPRHKDGKTLLEVLEEAKSSPGYIPYLQFKRSIAPELELSSSPPTEEGSDGHETKVSASVPRTPPLRLRDDSLGY
jgi:hypothetical protein